MISDQPATAASRDPAQERDRFFNLSLDMLCVAGFDGYFKQVNPAWEQTLGWAATDLLGRPWVEFVHPEDCTATIKAQAQLISGTQITRFENRYQHKDGSYRWLWWNAFPLVEAQTIFAVARDVTEQKLNETLVNGQKHILEMIATGRPLTETLDTLIHFLESQSSDMRCSILLLEPDGQHLSHCAAPSLPAEYRHAIDGASIGPCAGSCGTAAFRREAVIVEDIALDPLWADYRALALPHGLRACWSTPVFDSTRQVLGTFAIYYGRPGRPSNAHLRLIDVATQIAAIAISRQRDELTLRQIQNRHRRLFESGIIGITVSNTDGRISEANDAFLRMVGYTREEFDAGEMRWDTMTPPEWNAVDEHIISELKRSGSCAPVEKEYFRKDGSRLPILAAVALLDNSTADGLCLIEDLTQRKKSEAALMESEANYRRIIDTASEGIWTVDELGHTNLVNHQVISMLGYQLEEMLGHPLSKFMDEAAWNELAPKLAQRRQGASEQYEFRLRHRDGYDVWCFVSANPLLDAAGKFCGALAMLTDITERKKAEAALQASEASYRTLIESASDGILVVGDQGRIVDANIAICRMFGYSREAFLALTVVDVVAADEVPRLAPEIARLTDGEVVHSEWRCRRNNGTLFPVEVSGTLLPDGRLLGILRDVTERQQLESQFRQAQKMEAVGTLAGGIAHDFNNILTAVNGYTQLAKADAHDRPDLQKHLDAVLQGAHRATDLIKQIITFSRRQESPHSPVSVQKIVSEALLLMRATIPTTIEINTTLNADSPAVLADATQIHQIVINLCTNAWYAMKSRPGQLDIRIETVDIDEAFCRLHTEVQPGMHVQLTVADTGCGMDSATMERIFEPFFTTKTLGEGSGLGLAVVHGIMRSHRGTIVVDSKLDVGTTFKLYFPAHANHSVDSVAPTLRETPKGHGQRILIVDDESALLRFSVIVITKYGYVARPCAVAAEAIAALRAEPNSFDLVITDLAMPAMSGLDLAIELRSIRADIPIIVISGYVDSATQERITALNIQQLLLKPFTAESLGLAIHQVLSIKHSS